jgi:hypothetical protein
MLEVLRLNVSVTDLQSSIWVFLLLGSEAIKTYKSHPNFRYDLLGNNLLHHTNGLQSWPVQDSHLDFTPVCMCRRIHPHLERELPRSSLCDSCRLSP